ncbi:Cytochrome c-type protein NrfH [Phycisphaerae bacterium RAS1]|nr:Cytochrome c-type protein NrfH [Phycisphaerae bacterium RAS1]
MSAHHATSPNSAPPNTDPPAAPRKRRRYLFAIGGIFMALVIFGAAGLAGSEYYTSRPNFCGTCHIMGPYYESWSHDVHGEKHGVLCVDCHYAPGERLTIKAKFKGLSQVASYFSGRYGAGRPRAHVSDDSCMRSGCHGDNVFLTKMLPIGEPRKEKRLVDNQEIEIERRPTVMFYHTKHLDADEKLKEAKSQRETIAARLRSAIGDAAFEKVQSVSRSVARPDERDAAVTLTLDSLKLSEPARTDALALIDAEHRHLRLSQLSGLTCASCHNYDASGKNHIAVNRTACYTCHFNNETFNHGTGKCLTCHEAPSRQIVIHGSATSAPGSGPTLMDHNDVVKRNVNCESCHFDVVRGDASVNPHECSKCHDQSRFLEGFAQRDTDKVRQYHEVHVAGQRARCEDCHKPISHGLLEPAHIGDPDFLSPVLNDCQHCHPGHHSQQVHLLTGTGGAGLDQKVPNAMLGSRLNCRACHTQTGADPKGDAVIHATQQSCVHCHSDDYSKMYDDWKSEIAIALEEGEKLLQRVDRQVAAMVESGAAIDADIRTRVQTARHNLHLVQTGGGMHNKHFSLQLLDTARRELEFVAGKLRVE